MSKIGVPFNAVLGNVGVCKNRSRDPLLFVGVPILSLGSLPPTYSQQALQTSPDMRHMKTDRPEAAHKQRGCARISQQEHLSPPGRFRGTQMQIYLKENLIPFYFGGGNKPSHQEAEMRM